MKNKLNTSLSLRKLLLSALVAAPLATLPSPLWALPGTQAALDAVAPSKSIGTTVTLTSADTVTVTSTTTNSWVKWTDFAGGAMTIAAGENVNFAQPSATAASLSLVTGANPSSIAGNIISNGKVFIVNPNGITAVAGSSFNTAGLTLSTVPGESEVIFNTTGTLSSTTAPTNAVAVNGATITIGSSGSVALIGKGVDVSGTINAGTLTVDSRAGGAVNLANTAALTLGTAATSSTAGWGDLSVTTANAAVTIGTAANVVTINGGTATFTTAGGAVNQAAGAAAFTIGDSRNNGTLNINTAPATGAAGAVTLANITSGADDKTVAVTLNSGAADITTNVAATAKRGDITLNASTVAGNLQVTSGLGSIKSGGDVTVTGAASTISLTANGTDKTVTFTGPGDLKFAALSATGSTKNELNVTSTTGSVQLGTVAVNASGGVLNVTAQTDITQTAGITNAKTSTFNAVTGNITLTQAANNFGTVVLKGAPGGATVVDSNAFTIGKDTNVAGVAKITATTQGITLGGGSGDKVTFNSNVYLTAVDAGTAANGTITDASDNITVLGSLNLNASGDVVLNGNTGTSTGLKNQFGQINTIQNDGTTAATVANLTIFENTTLNLGTVTLAAAGVLKAYSLTSIVNSGLLTVPGATWVGAGTAAAPGDVALTYTTSGGAGNALTGTVGAIDDVALLSNTIGGTSPIGNYLLKNLSVTSQNAIGVSTPVNIYGAGLTGDVTLIGTGTAAVSNNANALYTSGKLTITTDSGAVNVNNTGNSFATVSVTSKGGAVNVKSGTKTALTVNAALTTSAASTASFESGGALTIGSYTSEYTGGTTFKTGDKKTVADSANGISIYGPVHFQSDGGVTINRSGHNFGGVRITTGNDGNATVVESGFLNLTEAAIAGKGTLSLTSTNGDIIRTSASGVTLGNTSATFTASKGNVSLPASGTNDFKKAAVNITSAGNVSIVQSGSDFVLGNITVAGTFSLDSSGKKISQASGSKMNVYGDTSFVTTLANDITVGNTGNKFGGVTLTTASGNVTVKEQTTLNLKSVTTSGLFSATSEGGNIIDSGTGAVAATGTTTLAAPAGNIALSLSGSNYNIVGFTTGGNVSIVDGVGDITLTTSTVAGKLDVVNTAGNILQDANGLSITGNTTFTANGAGSSITLGSANQFGPLKFVVGTGGATITEASTLNLRGGSFAMGPVNLISTAGDFITSGAGSSTFYYNNVAAPSLKITAVGAITPGADSLVVLNGLTVYASGTKDLSQLSKSGNLYGKDPVYQGPGADGATNPALAPAP